MKILTKITGLVLIISGLLFTSCKKNGADGFLSHAMAYKNPAISAVVGSSVIQSGAMLTDGSTLPLEFSIAAIYNADGTLATKAMNYRVDTYFWTKEYTGKETTNKQIDSARTKVNRPAIDINPANGNIIIYPEATDSLQLTKGTYKLDIKVKNGAGEQVLKNALTINVSYSLPYYYKFQGVDGKLSNFTVTFERLQNTGNKLSVYVLKNDGTPIDPNKLYGYDYADPSPDLKDWHNLGLGNPTKYTAFPDHLELEVAGFPIPFVAGKSIRIDMYNNGDANGAYFNYWYDFAILKEGVWKITVKLQY